MDRDDFWNGFYIFSVIQGMLVMVRIIHLVKWSWWIILAPTIIVFLGGLYFLIWFGLTCNPRIEKDDDKR